MKKVIIVLLVLFISTFSATQSKALIIDLGQSTFGQVTKIPPVTAEDMEGDFFSKMVPWVMGTLTNDGEETVTFDLISAGYSAGDIFSMFTSEFSSPIELDPGEVFSAPINQVVAVYLDFDAGDFVPAPIGMTSGIYNINFEFEVNGVLNYLSYEAPAGEFLWGVEVASPQNPVPEPATVLLFAAGLTGLAAIRRKKK